MFFLLITCLSSFIFIFNYSLPIKPLPSWASSSDTRLISFFFFKDLFSLLSPSQMNISSSTDNTPTTITTPTGDEENVQTMSVLDLPDLALESILERLPPDALFRMSSVCSDLRERCLSDHLWSSHFSRKWASIIGPAAYTHWHSHVSTQHSPSSSCFLQTTSHNYNNKGFLSYLSRLLPFIFVRSSSTNSNSHIHNFKRTISPQPPPSTSTSVVSFYQALESGKFWFPAQVFNRENGHVGFMLSCYDAELCYDSCTDTFQARYPPHGRRAVALESLITWDRLRTAPVDTSPHDLHVSDCLNDLRPKDHIEIQWRRNKEFPYGWWYGVVGHLETCDGNETYCRCHESESVVLEFNQYTPGSRWRHTTINRKDHREEGNEADGFYGGIRKLYRNEEISMWKHFWPAEILE